MWEMRTQYECDGKRDHSRRPAIVTILEHVLHVWDGVEPRAL